MTKITAINQKKIVQEFKQDIQDPGLSELFAQKETTYKEIKDYLQDPENEVPEEDQTIFLEIEKKYEVKATPKAKAVPVPEESKNDTDSEPEELPEEPKATPKTKKPKAAPKVQTPTLYEPTASNDFPELGLSNITSQQLKDVFSEPPQESEDPLEEGYRYIYHFKIGSVKYELYDKANDEDEFDEDPLTMEWYASSKGSMKALRKAFNVQIPYDELPEIDSDETITTEQLEEKSQRITNPLAPEDAEWRYGYYCNIGTKTFFVHDLANEQDEWDDLDDIEWYIRGNGAVRTLLKWLA